MSYLDLLLKIDSENATAVPAKTAKTAKTPFVGFVRQHDGVSEVHSAVKVASCDESACSRWEVHFLDANPLTVTFCPPVTKAEALAAYPSALAAVPILDPPPAPRGCATCRHRSRFSNCGAPVESGLVEAFELIKHPGNGRGCAAYEARASPLSERVQKMREEGLLDQDEMELILARYGDAPKEWDELLGRIARQNGDENEL